MTAAYQLPLPLPDRRRRRRPPPPIERRTHIAVADLLRVAAKPGWIFSHIANGEHRSKQTAALLQRMGVRAGLFDFLLIGPDGRHYWMELKRGRAPLSRGAEAVSPGAGRRATSRTRSPAASMRRWRACVSGTSCGRAGCSD